MRTRLTLSFLFCALGFCALGLLGASPVSAVDVNQDALDDAVPPPPVTAEYLQVADIAIVDTGDGSIENYNTRLTGLGYTVSLIPLASGYSTFVDYDMVLLPVAHAAPATYPTLASLAGDYHRFVADGGCLYIGQPNPFGQPGNEADIPWAPYQLRVHNGYNGSDCPPLIDDPEHCMAQGVSGSDLPFPGDTVLEMGSEWSIVDVGPVTGYPGLFDADYGSGHVLVELGNPSYQSICPYSDAGLQRLIECCEGAGTPTRESSWGQIKSLYR